MTSRIPMRRYRLRLAVLCVISLASTEPASTVLAGAPSEPAVKPRSVILMIGDGMGLNQLIAGRYLKGRLSVEDMKCMGMSYTHSLRNFVTDSSAGATVLGSGFLIVNGEVGVLPNGAPVKLITEFAEERGLWTGIVATSRITHATPASMATHVKSRGSEEDIALQLASEDLDVILGGGWDMFTPRRKLKASADDLLPDPPAAGGRKVLASAADVDPGRKLLAAEAAQIWEGRPYGSRKDGRDLVEEMKKRGYRFVRTATELVLATSGSPGRLLGLFHPGAMPKAAEGRSPSLSAMSIAALKVLSRSPKGFFLMIEGSQIDWGGHANDFDYVMNEAADFDSAIGAVREFLRDAGIEKETLLVITADHETGGLSLNPHPQLSLGLEAKWTTGGHTAAPVPVFSDGPCAEQFCGIQTHESLGRKLVDAVAGRQVEFAYPKDGSYPADAPPTREF